MKSPSPSPLHLDFAIAEFCGWRWMHRVGQPEVVALFSPTTEYKEGWTGWYVGRFVPTTRPSDRYISTAPWGERHPPRYTTSLDDMHAAEGCLSEAQLARYLSHLRRVCKCSARATALERATTFYHIHHRHDLPIPPHLRRPPLHHHP